ncbi:MAG: peptide chain release factor 2 [Phycisphaerae bacterium]|nr:peptide chain release factor 2 [Phycisphaerae bacterium]
MTLFDYDNKVSKRESLQTEMNADGFWNNQEAAQDVIARFKLIKAQIDPLEEVMSRLEEVGIGLELAKEANDRELLEEADEELFQLHRCMDKVELQSLLSNPHDHRNCFVAIQAGDGGNDADDFGGMVDRMYLYYWEQQGWKVEELSRTHGTEVGISEVSYLVKGIYSFGNMNCERGSHRLARVSPFNSQGKRQTSFVTVDVTPEFETTDLEIPETELEITPFARSSGPGGQNVNKVASAVRIVHKPTGIMVVASTFRDQPQNKRQAMQVLTAKLEQLEEERRQAELDVATGGKVDRGWGTQIRSYVLYDNRVKDHRTGHEAGNPQTVLDGALQPFIDAELRRRRGERERAE